MFDNLLIVYFEKNEGSESKGSLYTVETKLQNSVNDKILIKLNEMMNVTP